MAQQARCPSCGAPVEFKSVVSVLAVCDYCQSTLLRQGESLDNLGKMAALLEDRSPLQKGAEGRWNGLHFAVIGRIQLKYEHGLWNEWHLLFDDGGSGWLSEAGGEYVVSRPQAVSAPLPMFADLRVEQEYEIAGRRYTVTNLQTAECVAGEGELPFKVGAGYTAPVADLRDAQGGFATLDYSDDAARPLLFVGAQVEFARLAMTGLRDPAALPSPAVKARAFHCPGCGTPYQLNHENIQTFGCVSCGALLDLGSETIQLIEQAEGALKLPRLPLGSRGNLRGTAVEIVGYQKRSMKADGSTYAWDEYVCLGPASAVLWLTEYAGHWNLARVLPQSVAAVGNVAVVGKDSYKHFQSYEARVDTVLGEFPWRVRGDDRARIDDYIAPPRLLSRERTADEVSWTLAEYLDPAEIQTAFSPKTALPVPRGVFANQPNPRLDTQRRAGRYFWWLTIAALLIHLVLLLFRSGGALLDQSLVFSPADDEPRLTPVFQVSGATTRLEVASAANLANNWIGLGMTLVNTATGESWEARREISHYEGVEDGERWSEGSRSDSVYFRDIKPGTYRLALEPDLDAASPPVSVALKVERAGPRWSSLFLVLGLLLIFPVYTLVRRYGFEVERWAESDHPIITESEDDD